MQQNRLKKKNNLDKSEKYKKKCSNYINCTTTINDKKYIPII